MGVTRGSGSGNSGVGQPIPAGAREMVHSLKEIVNCSDAEIYAALKECNLDPNEAVHRLLSQDPFHEVKSKREKKKEGKDNTESKPCSNGNVSRSGKSGSERYLGRHGSAPYNSSDGPLFPGKSSNKKENGSSHASYLSSVPGVKGHGRSRGPVTSSEGFSAENKGSLAGTNCAVMSDFIPPAKSSWINHGQMSMADILKMGRSNDDTPPDQSTSHHVAHNNLMYPENFEPKNPYSGSASFQNAQANGEWPSMNQFSTATGLLDHEWVLDTEHHVEVSSAPSDQKDPLYEAKEDQHADHYNYENLRGSEILPEPIFSGKFPDDSSRENSVYKSVSGYQHQSNDLHEVDDIVESLSSITQNLQQLSVNKNDQSLLPEGCVTSVVIPDHLQVHDAECSHLSFGSFGAGLSIAQSSGVAASAPMKINLEQELPSEPEISSVRHSGTRISECYDNDSHVNSSSVGFFHETVEGSRNYDHPPVSQPNTLKHETTGLTHGNQYSFPSANSSFKFDDLHHSNITHSRTSSQMQELTSFSNVMAHTDPPPGILPSTNVHPTRESDIRYSQFSSAQLTPDIYGTSVSSLGTSAVAPEALTMAGAPASEPALPSALSTAQAHVPQHPLMHPYSPPSMPMGPFANLVTYPSYLPQSYTYMPSAFQQTLAGNSVYPQSLAGLLPQYKNSISPSTLHQPAAVAPGYGAFGNNTSIPVNYQTPAPSATNFNIDEATLLSLLQNENTALWLQGRNSRTMPSNSYHNYQANQQPGGFRQAQQQPSQNYGGVGIGYPNQYNSQAGFSPEQVSQNARDMVLGGSQAQPKQHQLWQNGGY